MDPFEMHRRLPSHQQRLAAEKQVNVYFVPGRDGSGRARYAYVVCSSMLHNQLMQALRLGVIPDYAVVVETGGGEPSAEVKAKILEYYGFDHDAQG